MTASPAEPGAPPGEAARLRRGMWRLLLAVAVGGALVMLLPGLGSVRDSLAQISPAWLLLGGLLEVLSLISYVVIFHPVFCPGVPWRVSAGISMAELGVTAVVPAGGAGGLALGAWALRRRGMPAERIASRSVAFFLVTSAANAGALAVFGLGLALGIFAGPAPVGMTLAPALAAIAGIAVVLTLPRALGGRGAGDPGGGATRARRIARASAVATVGGVRESKDLLRSRNPSVLLGAIGYWAFDNAVLWVCFLALGQPVPVAVVAVAYLVGQLGSLLPLPAGIGGVDLGLIGALVVLDVPVAPATAAVLSYRMLQLWIPAVLGGLALARLRRVLDPLADAASAA